MQFISTSTCSEVDFYAYADWLEERNQPEKASLLRRVPLELALITSKQEQLKAAFQPYGSLLFFEHEGTYHCQFGLYPYPVIDKIVAGVCALPLMLMEWEDSLDLCIAIGPTLGMPLLRRVPEIFGRKVVLMYGGCSLGSTFLSHLNFIDLETLEARWDQIWEQDWKRKYMNLTEVALRLTETLHSHDDFLKSICYIAEEEETGLAGVFVVKDGDDFIVIDDDSEDWIAGRSVFDNFPDARRAAHNWINRAGILG